MRKIPPGSEADNILVGEIDFLDHSISGFVRLNQACHLGDLTEVPVPTRFLFILLGPHRYANINSFTYLFVFQTLNMKCISISCFGESQVYCFEKLVWASWYCSHKSHKFTFCSRYFDSGFIFTASNWSIACSYQLKENLGFRYFKGK